MTKPSSLKKLAAVSALAIALAAPAEAQSILRDAETEHFLHEISDPMFKAAGLDPRSVEIYLLGDNSINAFVTGGQNIFIHSGLIEAANDVDELKGVIAHETGHISGAHLARMGEGVQGATMMSVISMVLGAAAIAAGGGDAGMGILMAGQSMAQRQFLAYTRVQESAADQAGATFLEATGTSATGMVRFFRKLQNQEILAQVRQDPYVRSHPLNSTRMLQLEQRVNESPFRDKKPDPTEEETFKRLQAKLVGYLAKPRQVLAKYPESDKSAAARYARVYAWHKAIEWDKALAEADALIEMEPENPYFHEIKGQILFENGRVDEAITVLKRATELAPDEALILTAYGQALVSNENPERMEIALPVLQRAAKIDPTNTFAWFNLARAYSWLNDEPHAALATAERFYSVGALHLAVNHARNAMEGLPKGSPDWIRAQDILMISEPYAEQMRERMRRR
ncbi:M48 family metalloprotease [Pseudokordiimonas caeni]|uniref:M48 family metalloprotease n=1 Tax=Pseudokordiimonas caeni TaxID=2997908 RepID=UPI0028122078|nr:M48 family metalloprotease [Pseudokordiimonas caeni]